MALDLKQLFLAEKDNRNVIALLKHLKETCAWDASAISVNGQSEINVYSTIHNEAMRKVYGRLRKHMPRELLIAIEIPEE